MWAGRGDDGPQHLRHCMACGQGVEMMARSTSDTARHASQGGAADRLHRKHAVQQATAASEAGCQGSNHYCSSAPAGQGACGSRQNNGRGSWGGVDDSVFLPGLQDTNAIPACACNCPDSNPNQHSSSHVPSLPTPPQPMRLPTPLGHPTHSRASSLYSPVPSAKNTSSPAVMATMRPFLPREREQPPPVDTCRASAPARPPYG